MDGPLVFEDRRKYASGLNGVFMLKCCSVRFTLSDTTARPAGSGWWASRGVEIAFIAFSKVLVLVCDPEMHS